MRLTPLLMVVGSLVLGPWAGGEAAAQTAPAGRYRCTLQDNMLTVVDTTNNFSIISPNLQKIVADTTVDSTVAIVPVPGGCDLTVTLVNHGSRAAPLGMITVPGMRLGPTVKYRDF